MRKFLLSLTLVLGALVGLGQAQQNYNFNVGGLGFSSGASLPGSCATDGYFFWLNSGTKAWYVCVNGAFVGIAGSTSGTVNAAAAAGNAYYAAAGNTISADTSITDNGSGTLSIGTTGQTGTLNINGATAGVSAPITTLAGGLTLVFPTGTSTNPGQNYVSNNSNSGWVGNGVGGVNWASSGVITFLIGANGGTVQNSGTYGFNRSGSREAGLSDESAATGSIVLALDSGTIGNEGALLRSANTCRLASDVTLTVNSPINICQFSLPAVAKTWAYTCNFIWAITAETGTTTLSLGVNASQTPTSTSNVTAEITTSTAGAQTNGTVALSASGALNVETSGSITASATLFPAMLNGGLNASATAGTFTITATAAATTVTAAMKAGSYCQIF